MTPSSDIGRAVAAATRTINQSVTVEETLQAISDAACRSVPGFDQVGISTLAKDGTLETRASTGDLVPELDSTQYSLGEGPCVDALHGADLVVAPRIGADPRWPRYGAAATAAGVRSQLAVRLTTDEQGIRVGINLYSTTSDEVSEEAVATAELFATHAAIALGNARERANLNEALQSRKVIGQAIGIVMERYGLDEDRAFSFLVRGSSHGNVKLRDVAQKLVDEFNER